MSNPWQDEWVSPCGRVRLFLGDCLEILPALEAGSIDAVVTDPPYGVGFSRYESHDDAPDKYEQLISSVVVNSQRLLISGGLAFFWQGMKNSHRWHDWFPEGYRIFAALRNFTQFLPTPVQYSWDPVIWFSNGKTSRRAIAGQRDYHMGNTAKYISEAGNGHPCPRPLDTVEYVVQLASDKNELIIDPFVGSGTTGVACVRTGRCFVGCEIEPKYFNIARSRIEIELREGPKGQLDSNGSEVFKRSQFRKKNTSGNPLNFSLFDRSTDKSA